MNSLNSKHLLSDITEPAHPRRLRRSLRPNPKGTLREQVREVCRFLHFSARTEAAYWHWTVRFLKFHRRTEAG